MIKGIVFTEGGGPSPSPPERAFAGVADGQQILQNAFSQLFQQVIPDLQVPFIFDMRGGWQDTLYDFGRALAEEQEILICLLIDYADVPGENYLTKKEYLNKTLSEKEGLPVLPSDFSEYFGNIFFMVQKMEAWILSQPKVIDQCFGHLRPLEKLAQFNAQKTRRLLNPASAIPNPDTALNELLGYCVKVDRKGISRRLKYEKGGKVKLAYEMLTKLDLFTLMAKFEDVRALVEKLKSV